MYSGLYFLHKWFLEPALGPFMGIPPTGKHVTATGMAIIRVAHGKIVEEWANADDLGLMQQLGVIPTPGQESK